MSLEKAKQLKEFSAIPKNARFDALQFGDKLHREAFDYKQAVHNGLWLKANPQSVPEKDHKWIAFHHDRAVAILTARFMDAYRRKKRGIFSRVG